MKPIAKKIWMFLAVLWASISTFAYDFEVDGIYYNIDAAAGTAVITTGDTPYTGEIIVPNVISVKNRDLKVVSIGQAFNNTTITAISIGKNISEIQYEAFKGCNRLKEITFSPSEDPIKINNTGYFNSFGCFYKLPLEKVVFGRSVVLSNGSDSPFIYI